VSILEKIFYQITGPSTGTSTGTSDTNAKNGQPERLVFLHGVMGFAANWRSIAKAFEDRYQVLVFDQRGHGRSFKPAVGYSPDDYAQDLKQIIDELGWTSINLVGHSMGGRNAVAFTSRFPSSVRRLVIEDIGPTMNQAGSAFILGLLDRIPTPFASRRAAKEYFSSEFLKTFAHVRNKEGLAAYLNANIVEDESGQGVWRFYEPGIRESVEQGRATELVSERWDELRTIGVPTLLVRGEYSQDLPREVFERILKENPKIQGVEIKGAGHWVHSDQPQAFIAALKQFFDSTS